jgi:Protein of unknown function (DUF751)
LHYELHYDRGDRWKFNNVEINDIVMGDLWGTVSKYPRFLVGVMLGVIFNVFAPLTPLFKRPITAIALTGVLGAAFALLIFTLRAMLDLGPIAIG